MIRICAPVACLSTCCPLRWSLPLHFPLHSNGTPIAPTPSLPSLACMWVASKGDPRQPHTGQGERCLFQLKCEQGSDLIELRQIWGKRTICFFWWFFRFLEANTASSSLGGQIWSHIWNLGPKLRVRLMWRRRRLKTSIRQRRKEHNSSLLELSASPQLISPLARKAGF